MMSVTKILLLMFLLLLVLPVHAENIKVTATITEILKKDVVLYDDRRKELGTCDREKINFGSEEYEVIEELGLIRVPVTGRVLCKVGESETVVFIDTLDVTFKTDGIVCDSKQLGSSRDRGVHGAHGLGSCLE